MRQKAGEEPGNEATDYMSNHVHIYLTHPHTSHTPSHIPHTITRPTHSHRPYIPTYHKFIDPQPVDLRPRFIDEGDSDPPLNPLLEHQGPPAPPAFLVVHGHWDVLPRRTELTDLKVGKNVHPGERVSGTVGVCEGECVLCVRGVWVCVCEGECGCVCEGSVGVCVRGVWVCVCGECGCVCVGRKCGYVCRGSVGMCAGGVWVCVYDFVCVHFICIHVCVSVWCVMWVSVM